MMSRASEPVTAVPVVGIGASAGGLDAFTQLLKCLPPNSGMAFVLVQHLDRTHASYLREALVSATSMNVSEVENGTVVEANHVYVIPPNKCLVLDGGKLTLTPRPEGNDSLNLPIDFFFHSLAVQRGARALGVVLSGTACDGTEGLRAIKAENGITFAQDPQTAKFSGMPLSAVTAGVVDYCLDIPQLAEQLFRLSRHSHVASGEFAADDTDTDALDRIFSMVRKAIGVDFTEYKAPTFRRRLHRRMALRGVEHLDAYCTLLEEDSDEVRSLYEDVLIHFTSFFRDPQVFEALKQHAFPEILRKKEEGAPLRMWVAGCSTGEELYSLAIVLLEFLGDASHPIQIFGSDVSDKAIEEARAGVYPESALGEVSEGRRKAYFMKVDRGYRINQRVRDLCVFVQHDLARDPPFSKLDLVSCRNVLIYFDQRLQKRIVPAFHYALNQPGFLLLGGTENISGFGHLFSIIDKGSHVFSRNPVASKLRLAARYDVLRVNGLMTGRTNSDFARPVDVSRQLDALLLARYAAPGVLVNEKMEILEFRGQTGSYLQPAPGLPQNNLVKMARPGLLSAVRSAVAQARSSKGVARESSVRVEQDGAVRTCDVVAIPFPPLKDVKEQLFAVLFEAAPALKTNADDATPDDDASPSSRAPGRGTNFELELEVELAATKEYLESLVEEHGRTYEDLGSANEELISGNEELQSMNEELETAKEELQSTNEELTTLNEELRNRNHEATQINSDLVNLLGTVTFPILILDRERRIRRFTPSARDIWNVLPSDIGRPLEDIKPNIDAPNLDQQIAQVIDMAVAHEFEIQDREGKWYRLQIRPYTRADNRADGAILSMVDIDAMKRIIDEAQLAKIDAERANRAKDDFLAVLSHELRTPLSSMLLNAQLLRRSKLNSAKVQKAADAFERGIEMQTQLINDLLDVSRIVSGKLTIDMQVVPVAKVVRAALDVVSASAEKKSVQIKLAHGGAVGSVMGDATRLQQVLINLISNAVKFTPEGGRVDIKVVKDGGVIRLVVSDSGVGIDAAFLPHVFNRFTQADSSHVRAYGGLGLGLAIVRHLVEAHGGSVEAASPGVGHGATFTVTLPVPAVQPELGEPAGAHEAVAKRKKYPEAHTRLQGVSVLVVDDDGPTRDALAEVLGGAGAQVVVAASVADAMAASADFKPGVLLCDIAMPGEDGYSLIRRWRTLGPPHGEVPALALTALVAKEDRERTLAAGFQMHLPKPVDIDQLLDALSTLFPARASAPPPPQP